MGKSNKIALEQFIEQRKKSYFDQNGTLDSLWYDEGIIFAITDYLSNNEPTKADYEYARKEYDIFLEQYIK